MKLKQILSILLYPVLYIVDQIYFFLQPIKVYDQNETIELLKKGYSVSRFGDGEYNICLNIHGHPIFQDMSNDLMNKMNNILKTNWDNEKFVVAQVGALNSFAPYNKQAKFFFVPFIFTRRREIIKLLHDKGKNQKYGEAFFPRIDVWKDDNIECVFKTIENLNEIWENKIVLTIEGEDVKLGVNNDLLHSAKQIKRIIIPNKNAFFVYEEIMEITEKIGEFDLILIVAGPTATALAADLYKKGYQAIDFGQMQKGYMKTVMENGEYKYSVLSEFEYKSQIKGRVKNNNII